MKKGVVDYAEEGQTSQRIPADVVSSDRTGEQRKPLKNGVGMGTKDTGGNFDTFCGKGSYTHKKFQTGT